LGIGSWRLAFDRLYFFAVLWKYVSV
jgi:hypothetical protein